MNDNTPLLPDGPADRPPLRCARCAAALRPGAGDLYVVQIVAVADPFPPVIPEEDLERDLGREIHGLLDRLRAESEGDLRDQVYRGKVLYFCTPCYRHWIEDPAHGGRGAPGGCDAPG